MDRREATKLVADAIQSRYGSYTSTQAAKWDITDRTRHPLRSVGEPGHERAVLGPEDRADAIELSRDLHRNDATLATVLWQFAVNVVGGNGGKASFWSKSDPDWARQATDWYNHDFAKHCDGQNLRTHLTTQYQTAIVTVLREGDCLLFFDDLIDDDGRVYWYEADELALIRKADWANRAVANGYSERDPADRRRKIPLSHTSPGIVRDRRGRVTHIVVSTTRKARVRWEEATILPIDSVCLLRRVFRFGQHRGVGAAWSVYDTLADVKEGTAEELRSLRELNKKAIVITEDDDAEEALTRFGKTVQDLVDEVAEGGDPKEILRAKRYEAIETAYEHASTTYLPKDGKLNVIESNRPAPSMQQFWEDCRIAAGAAFGLARCYTQLKVSNNFSSARAEFLISWATFSVLQKLLERGPCDFIAPKAVAWASRKGILPEPPKDWSVSFSWPVMPMVDPGKEIRAIREKIAAGLTTWQEQLGPEYRKIFQQLAKEFDELKEDGLDRLLDVFFTVAGASKEATAEEAVAAAIEDAQGANQ